LHIFQKGRLGAQLPTFFGAARAFAEIKNPTIAIKIIAVLK